jgi:hypothetical protein
MGMLLLAGADYSALSVSWSSRSCSADVVNTSPPAPMCFEHLLCSNSLIQCHFLLMCDFHPLISCGWPAIMLMLIHCAV